MRAEVNILLSRHTLNLLSHGKYAIHEPTEMIEDNKELFRRILRDFTTKFQFALPEIAKMSPISGPGIGATS